jgi:Trk-type K+ transport system membrane component
MESIEALGYITLYVTVLFAGGYLVTLFAGTTFNDAIFEFSNALAGTGLTNGLCAVCRDNSAFLWTMIVGMFAGRLEILPIYFAIYRIVRDGLRKETL